MFLQNIHVNQLGKNVFTTLAFLLLTLFTTFGQGVPQAFKYQAVIRDAMGEVVPDTPVEMQMSILVQGPNANYPNIIYQETHDAVTNRFGLVSLEVGNGEVIFGDFSTIDWAAADHFLGVEVSIDGGPFIDLGSTQLLSVPYALLAQKAVEGDADDDPENELQKLIQTGNEVELTLDGGTITVADDDNDPVNEIQTLSQNGNDVTLSNNGGTISVADNDNDSSNEIQDISINGHDLTLSSGSTITLPDNVDDADADPANEIQTLSQSGNNVTLSNNGGTISVADNDNDSSNELQDWSNLPGIPGDLLDGDDTDDADADPANEIQTLSLNGSDLSISGGNTVILSNNGSDLPVNPASGTMVYYDGSEWLEVPPGEHEQTLSFCHGAPYWGTCPELPAVPTLHTRNFSNKTSYSATTGGNVWDSHGSSVTERGICWSFSPNPTTDDNIITIGGELGEFWIDMEGLILDSTYYVRAYAINASGTGYGAEKSYTAYYQTGEEAGGGFIFYVASPGEDLDGDGSPDIGLVAAPADEAEAEWGCKGIDIPGIPNENGNEHHCHISTSQIGKGDDFTDEWKDKCDQDGRAAKVCIEKSLTVDNVLYDDWFLPSLDELELIYDNLYTAGIGNFTNGFYWSSSERDSQKAVGLSFSGGSCFRGTKTDSFVFRAVRVF